MTEGTDGYDLLLASVPVPVAGGALVGVLSSLPLVGALAAGSLVASMIIGFALFLVPP